MVPGPQWHVVDTPSARVTGTHLGESPDTLGARLPQVRAKTGGGSKLPKVPFSSHGLGLAQGISLQGRGRCSSHISTKGFRESEPTSLRPEVHRVPLCPCQRSAGHTPMRTSNAHTEGNSL